MGELEPEPDAPRPFTPAARSPAHAGARQGAGSTTISGLRICLLTTFYPPHNFGGDGIGIRRLAHALVRRGHRVTVAHDVDAFRALWRGPEPAADPEPEGLEVVRLRSRLGALSPLLTQQTGRPVVHGRALRALLEAGRFDVVQYNNISLLGGPGLLAYGGGVKLYEAHEHWLVCASHVLWRHDREACTGRQCLRCVLHFRRPPQLWRYTGALERQLHRIDAFIAKSEFSRAKHREFGFPAEMEVVPYFLPDLGPGEEREAEPERPHERPYFLFVGRLEPIKGVHEVVPIFRDYDRADLLIAGDGTQADALRSLAEGNPRVRFLGRVAPAELRRLYRHAIALIVPSVGFETFGIILIEAMRQRTPVLARRIGPFPEIVERGGGLLFDDAGGLRQQMSRLRDDPELRAGLAEQGLRAFRAHWSESVVVPRYLDLVRRVALRRGLPGVAASAGAENAA